ncbi:MAG: Y-family DNA polymerase [Wenzhouxiangellaceae bacterium]
MLRPTARQISSGRPLAIHEIRNGRATIIAVNRSARELEVAPGRLLADAQAIAPALEAWPRNRAAEHDLLAEIALIAWHYSHQVAITGDGVVLETGGSRRLHGDTQALLRALSGDLQAAGLFTRLGTAPVPAAACLLARHGRHADDPEMLCRMLDDWPLQRLQLSEADRRRLDGLGLRRVAEIRALPGFERERRLGASIRLHLEQLYGQRPTPLSYWQPPEQFRRQIELPVPTHLSEALLFALNRALVHLGQWLRVRDRALTGLRVELHPEDGDRIIELHAGLGQAGFQRERLLEILRLKLEPLRLESDIESLLLCAEDTVEHRPPQADLWTGNNGSDDWPALLDRLRARIGDKALCSLAPCPDHRPEKAWKWTEPGSTAMPLETPPRPNWLLPAPRPCRVEQLRLIEGPERIETGWWDGHDCRRDYWIAHDRHGNRLWVFREYKPSRGWFIHGLFG